MSTNPVSDTQTSYTLLTRVRDVSDQQAWQEFVECYAPKIFLWCRRFHLQESDASDITQEVLVKLVGAMQSFVYDPARGTFRGWLKTITTNAVHDLGRTWQRDGRPGGDERLVQLMQSLEDPEAVRALEEVIEGAHRQQILQEAETQVALRVQSHTWKAYQLTAVEERPAAQVARDLQMPISEVYVAKSRVLKMLRETITRLEDR
jgi:RNA polymerase sigma-70 factor (ECF subfamily)